MDWEEISVNNKTNTGLISKIYKKLLKFNKKKKKKKLKKWAEDLNRHFFKKDIQIANRHMRWCSSSINIREMQIKTAMRYYLTLIRMTTSKKSNNKRQRGCGEKEPSYTVGGNVNWCSHYRKQYGNFSKN